MQQQLPLPIASYAIRDDAYRAELARAALPAAARRVAEWMLEAGHPQQTDAGERLYAVAGGNVRALAARSRIPRSTLHRGLTALGAAGLAVEARGCLCLVASRLCELAGASEIVPSAPTGDWGQVCLPRRSPERPTSPSHPPACPNLSQFVPTLSQFVPVCPNPVPTCPSLSQSGSSTLSARAQVVVVKEFINNNNRPAPPPEAVKTLARRAWRRLHGDGRHPPRPDDRARLLLLRCAWLALATELGERWLLASAAARPLRAQRLDAVRFFQAAAAYQAWEHAAGEQAESEDARREARRQFREILAAVDLPEELRRREAANAAERGEP